MAQVEQILYTVECDNCRENYQSDDFGFWLEYEMALEKAVEDGWTEEEGNHYCKKCHHYDDEDELIINTKRLID